MTYSFLYFLIVLIAHYGTTQAETRRCRRDASSNICFLAAENEEGPYYWNYSTYRTNIREDRQGIPFTLQLTVVNVNTCSPIPMAVVDIWHCDSLGVYSHYQTGANATWLRGVQYTNSSGVVTFNTIYPGWYQGRTIHIHVKVHVNGTFDNTTGLYVGGHVSHTDLIFEDSRYATSEVIFCVGQVFFNDTITALVAQTSYYLNDTATRTLNTQDTVYTAQNGSYASLSLSYINSSLGLTGGLVGTLTLGIDPTATPSIVAVGTGGGFRPGNGSGPMGFGNQSFTTTMATTILSTSNSISTNSVHSSSSHDWTMICFIVNLFLICTY